MVTDDIIKGAFMSETVESGINEIFSLQDSIAATAFNAETARHIKSHRSYSITKA